MAKVHCEGDVIYSRKVPYCGRNGCFNMTGAYISETSKDDVRIEPRTTRNTIGRCLVEIPKEDIPAVIGKLQKYIDAETAIAKEESRQKCKIIVDVSGGNVQAIYSSDPDIEVRMCDWDNAACDDEYKAECEALSKEMLNLAAIY